MKFFITLPIIFTAIFSKLEFRCCAFQIINNTDATKKLSNFITKVPLDNKFEGFVTSSYSKFNLGKKEVKKFSIGILIDYIAVDVKDYKENHKETHEIDSICNLFRITYVVDDLYYNTLHIDSFKMIDTPRRHEFSYI